MSNSNETMRAPGFSLRSWGRSRVFSSGSRYSATTSASLKSILKMSAA
jgi:hypothetical protein